MKGIKIFSMKNEKERNRNEVDYFCFICSEYLLMESPIFLATILRTLMNTYMPPSEAAMIDATYKINHEARIMMPMPSIAARNGKSHDGILNEKLSKAKKKV